MKLLLGTCALLLAAVPLTAQTKEGKITYEQKINVHKRMPPEAEQFKAMVPEFQTNMLELYFTPTQSLFKPAKQQGDQLPTPEGGGPGGGGRFMRFGGGDNAETFRDYENEMVIESRELGPKRYLIEDSLRPLKWKLEEETMTINGFVCKKATTTIQGFGMGNFRQGGGGQGGGGGRRDSTITRMLNEKQQVVAWYTEQIETAAGPDNYFGLPGLILYLDIDNGTIVYSPKKLEPLSKDVAVKAPTKGNKITRQEYRQLMQQQFQGMGGRPGGGTFMIRQQ
ncbi:MAG: GLPGLI family protein [Chitinophagaceae bacterium]|nr:GLPGLI family protein [Chitinophagaceae bacterium]